MISVEKMSNVNLINGTDKPDEADNKNRFGAVLIVDLDGTLVKTDMLYETFWFAFAERWYVPFGAAGALWHGRAALKRWLNDLVDVDVTLLPYNSDVIDYIQRWQAAGGTISLVTASDQELADKIAAHLGIFDEVFGSDGAHNLKGRNKARFLCERYGHKNYTYVGDSAADGHVWDTAAKAITVNASGVVRATAESLCRDVEHLSLRALSPLSYIDALHPWRWLMNLLVFAPILITFQFSATILLKGALTFAAFCLVASGFYVLNDLLNLSADRRHPQKRLTPFASGRLPITQGPVLSLILLLSGLVVGALTINWQVFGVLLIYSAGALVYLLGLRRVRVIGICTLFALLALRVLAGAMVTG